MAEKKYQVFISSTYEDLKDERKAVEETIIRAGDIPVGMEAFPAADEEQFQFIRTVIDFCDYYVLIVAGRYGSRAEDGFSYTEKEFDYAVEKGIPVLFLMHNDIEKLPANLTEKEPDGRDALNRFIKKASANRIRKSWNSIDGLKLAVREALDHSKATKLRPGWIRGDTAASEETLLELNELRKEVERLRQETSTIHPYISGKVAGLDTIFELRGTRLREGRDGDWDREEIWSVRRPLKDFFLFVAPNMRGELIHRMLNNRLGIAALGGKEENIYKHDEVSVNTESFNRVILQLEALGLIETHRLKTQSGNNADFSKLSEKGTAVMFDEIVKRET